MTASGGQGAPCGATLVLRFRLKSRLTRLAPARRKRSKKQFFRTSPDKISKNVVINKKIYTFALAMVLTLSLFMESRD